MRARCQLIVLAPVAVFAALLANILAGDKPSPSDFVEIVRLDPTILIELPYATDDNFCGVRLYPVERCFLRREAAEHLVAAHRSLAEFGLGLKVWDGYRPHSVQYRMWELAPSPGYLSRPERGSRHNRGAAVDVTLVNLFNGEELEMPTPYDEFSERAHSTYLKLPPNVAENRRLLHETMRAHGFSTIRNEWWHFDYLGWDKFPLEDIPIEALAEREDRLHGPPPGAAAAAAAAAESEAAPAGSLPDAAPPSQAPGEPEAPQAPEEPTPVPRAQPLPDQDG